ncbi:MAG: NAD(P)H-dependent oxidoreductase subunit E [Dehalococcoidia bacterium]|nr:MAG: NAD(P)H-dependent oxidoreductase subunit E [Dehalococcoidia bacterium]
MVPITRHKELTKVSRAVKQAVGSYQRDQDMLIQILLDLQSMFGWLSEEVLTEVSEQLGVPVTRVYQIASYYKAFSLVPTGRHIVKVCLGTACQVRGAPQLLNVVSAILKMKPTETSADMRFTLETVNCLGCCAMGPVIAVDGIYHSKPSTSDLRTIFEVAK